MLVERRHILAVLLCNPDQSVNLVIVSRHCGGQRADDIRQPAELLADSADEVSQPLDLLLISHEWPFSSTSKQAYHLAAAV